MGGVRLATHCRLRGVSALRPLVLLGDAGTDFLFRVYLLDEAQNL